MIIMPIPTGGGGYNGPNIDITSWAMPDLPEGWHWQVTDKGGRNGIPFRGMAGWIAGNPCIVWLYIDQYTFVDSEHDVQRSRTEITRAAQAIIIRSAKRAHVDRRFTPFTKEHS